MLKPVSINAIIFDGKKKIELYEFLFHRVLKMQPQMTEAMKTNHFHAHIRKETQQTIRKKNASNRKVLDDVIIVFQRK